MNSSKYHRLKSFHPFFKIYIQKCNYFFGVYQNCLVDKVPIAYTIVEIFVKCFINRFAN